MNSTSKWLSWLPFTRQSPDETLSVLNELVLNPIGWHKSKSLGHASTADGAPLPWFTYGAIEFLRRIVSPTSKVFEYGSGFGTVWWQRAGLVYSVDHNRDWVNQIAPLVGDHVSLNLVEANARVPSCGAPVIAKYMGRKPQENWSYPPERIVARGLDDRSFEAYASRILELEEKFDFVVIDGMARRLCAEFAVTALKESGVIVLDNSNRSDYSLANVILQDYGFHEIPFWGLVPGADFMTCTSIFIRDLSAIPLSGFVSGGFGFPEY